MTQSKLRSELRRILRAYTFSRDGFKQAWRTEAAFRTEIILSLPLIALACMLRFTALERVLLIGSIFIVWAIELLNSAIEAAIDRIGPEQNPLSKAAKDFGSAAVLIALLNVLLTWGMLLYAYFH